MWQGPLEQAGFSNAILARDAPTREEDPDWDPGDLRYSVIRWAPGPRENALGPDVVDPRSGEVISSHTLVWHDALRLAELWYFTQVAPLDPRAQEAAAARRPRGRAAALRGRTRDRTRAGAAPQLQGALRPTPSSSCATASSPRSSATRRRSWTIRASTTSPSRVTMPTCSQDRRLRLLRHRLGLPPVFPGARGCDAEWPQLDRMAARQLDEPALRFGGENEAAKVDPNVTTQVLGSDPDRGHRHGLAQHRPGRRNADPRHHQPWPVLRPAERGVCGAAHEAAEGARRGRQDGGGRRGDALPSRPRRFRSSRCPPNASARR